MSFGIVRGRLRFTIRRSLRHLAAALLVGYGLAYPFINLVLFEYPRVPTFGVPCPTAILTAGLLVAAARLA